MSIAARLRGRAAGMPGSTVMPHVVYLHSAPVLSQVVLSFGIPFALVPLVVFTAKRAVMGDAVNRPVTTIASALIAGVVIALDAALSILTV